MRPIAQVKDRPEAAHLQGDHAGPSGACQQCTMTRLAVLIPVYNDQAFLERALAWLGREDTAFDAVIVDDGSEPPIRIPPALPFPVELIRLPRNAGIVAALNAGLEHIVAAGYAYVARMDADDISLPGRFRAQMEFLDAHIDHAVVGSWYEEVDANLATLFVQRPPTRHEELIREFRYRNPFAHSAVMIRVATLRHHAWYDERYRGTEDYELFFRLAQRERVANLATVFLRCQVTGKTSTSRRAFGYLHRLRVQLYNFEPRSPHAYLGLLRTCLMMLVPWRAAVAVRRLWA
jgi:glycosyltransferase involved in cell wall biosynthesis